MFKSDHKFLILLISLAIIRGIIYISIIPPWLGPDEASHFEAIRLIGQEKLWPTQEVYQTTPMHPEMHASFLKFGIWQASGMLPPPGFLTPDDPSHDPYIYYYPLYTPGSVILAGDYPLVYHLLLSPVSALIKPLDITSQVYILRLCSLLFTILTIVTGWFFGRTIFPEKKIYAVTLVSFLVFSPMYMYINTSVSVDALVTLFASLYFLLLAKIFCQRPAAIYLILALGLLFLAVSTKPTALFLVPVSGAALIIYFARPWRWKLFFLTLSLLAMIIFTFFGAVLLYQFTGGGRGISNGSFSIHSLSWPQNYLSRTSLAIYSEAIQRGFISFWGLFASIPIPVSWLRPLWLICALVGIGDFMFLAKHVFNWQGKSSRLTLSQRNLLVIILLALIFNIIGLYAPVIATQSALWSGSQSRYLFPAFLPFVLYFFLGFQQLFPIKWSHLILPTWLIGSIMYDVLTILYVIIPSRYG
jgi:hypothetical protein